VFNIEVRVGVLVGGIVQERQGTAPTVDELQRREEQEFMENLPGYVNIGIATLFVLQGYVVWLSY
jgi:hypothetical protein